MPPPRILVIPGCIHAGSDDARLAALAAQERTLAEAQVSRLSLADYPMPLYDPAVEAEGVPPGAVELKRVMSAHQGVFLTTPELNASVTPLMSNTIGWVSRVHERNDSRHGVFHGRVFAIGAATPDSLGGVRALMALRQILELGCGALVLPEQISVQEAGQAFDDMDNLADVRSAELLRTMARRLVDLCWHRLGA
jgi:NAD(P)H-dependent FMN reductase